MTLEEAIKHCEEVAEANERMCKAHPNARIERYRECAREHRELEKWLRELQHKREILDGLEKAFRYNSDLGFIEYCEGLWGEKR